MEQRVEKAVRNNEKVRDLYNHFYECLMDTSDYVFIVTKVDCFTFATTRAAICKEIIFQFLKREDVEDQPTPEIAKLRPKSNK